MPLKDKEAHKLFCKNYYIKNKEHILQKTKEHQKNNKERRSITNKEWYKNHPDKDTLIARSAVRHKVQRGVVRSGQLPPWITSTELWLMEECYSLAKLRSSLTGISWVVDHIIPLRGKDVSGLHVPTNLQVIPAKLNFKKGVKHSNAFPYTFYTSFRD
jgi:hypothetical protein